MKTEKLGGVAAGEGECGDDVAGWLVRERRSLDILPVKKEAKLSASGVPGEVVQQICVKYQKNCGFGGKSTKIGTDHAEYT